MRYEIKPWKKYELCDNGVYAPKGSQPTFHTELNVFRHDTNPIHPFAQGYVMHEEMKPDELVPIRRVMLSNICGIELPNPERSVATEAEQKTKS